MIYLLQFVGLWKQFAPYTVVEASDYNAPHDTIFSLPQLGGRNFGRSTRFFPSLQLDPPMVPTRTLREISARTRSLTAAQAEIDVIHGNACDRSFGCTCLRCTSARVLLARPNPPTTTPPRLRSIPERPPITDRYGANIERRNPTNTRPPPRNSLVLQERRVTISSSSPVPSPRFSLVDGDDHASIRSHDQISTARLTITDGQVTHISDSPNGASSTFLWH